MDVLHNTTEESQNAVFRFTDLNICWVVVFVITAITSAVGNILVILVYRTRFPRKSCESSLRPYLINLAVADLIMAIFCMPFTFIDAIAFWVFPKEMCPFVLFLQVLSVAASVFTNVAIGINRLRAIIFPLHAISKMRAYSGILTIIWLTSIAMSSVQMVVGEASDSNGTVHCAEVWPNNKSARAYTLFIFFTVYVFPLILLILTYTAIGVSLWRNPRRDDIIRSKAKVRHY